MLGSTAGTIDESQKEITFAYPYRTNVSNLVAKATISPHATISPVSSTVKDYSKPVTFTVTSEDGKTEKVYTITVTVQAKPAPPGHGHIKSKEAEVTRFSFGVKDEIVDIGNLKISVILPQGTPTTQTATLTLSKGATITSSFDPREQETDYSDDVTFTVTSEDEKTTNPYTVKVEFSENTEAKIKTFTLGGKVGTINHTKEEITVGKWSYGSDVGSLKATYTKSDKSTIDKDPTTAMDYSDDVTFTVTSEDGKTKKTYTVKVEFSENTEAKIKTFTLGGKVGTIDHTKEEITFDKWLYGSDVRSLTAIYTKSDKSTIDKDPTTARDYSDDVTFTVTSEDGKTKKTYTVKVEFSENTEAKIKTFTLDGKVGTINHTKEEITVGKWSYGSDVGSLKATYTKSDKSTIDKDPTTAMDYSDDVTFTVTSEDEKTKKTYTVKVEFSENTEAKIKTFTLGGKVGTIDHTKEEITFSKWSYGSGVGSLKATYTKSDKSTIDKDPTTARDYSDDVTFTVTSEDGKTKKTYTVKVTVAPASTGVEITNFSFGVDGEEVTYDYVSSGNMRFINVTLPFGTSTTQKATFTLSTGARVTQQDVRNSMDYGRDNTRKFTVTAQDGTTEQDYRVTVTFTPGRTGKAITRFTMGGRDGQIDQNTKEITFASFAAGTKITSWSATVVISAGASILPDPSIAMDYTDDVIFTVRAEDGTTQRYTVKVSVLKFKEAKVKEFKFNEGDVVNIDNDKGEINISVPYQSDVNSRENLRATASFSLSRGASIKNGLNPSTTAADYSSPQTFTVTAEDGVTEKIYTVKVKIKVTNANRFAVVYGEIRRMGGTDDTVFKGDLNHLDMSSVWNMDNMFAAVNTGDGSSPSANYNLARMFNGDISEWDVGSVWKMDYMFHDAKKFNQALNDWEVGNVKRMWSMFDGATNFNQALNDWEVGNVTHMERMFDGATNFNQNLNAWDVKNVRYMGQMFFIARSFNGNISNWKTVKVWRMYEMFTGATSFNQDISGWDVKNVGNMDRMFSYAVSFDQDLSEWETGKVKTCIAFAAGVTAFEDKNKPSKKDSGGTCDW